MIISIFKNKFSNIKSKSKIVFVKDRPGHDLRYALNSKKINKKLEWKIKINLIQGLVKTISWYINNPYYFKSIRAKNHIKRVGLKI